MTAPQAKTTHPAPDAAAPLPPVATDAPPVAPLAADQSLATAWPQTATAQALVLSVLVSGIAFALASAVWADGSVAWFLPLAAVGIGAGKLALDVPLSSAEPGAGSIVVGVSAATLCVVGSVLAVLLLGGAGAVGVPLAVVTATSGTAFSAAVALRGWERRFLSGARRILFVGNHDQHRELVREIGRHQGMSLVSYVDVSSARAMVASVEAQVNIARPSMLVFSSEAAQSAELCDLAVGYSTSGMRLATLGDLYRDHFGRVPLRDVQSSWVIREIADLHRPRTYSLVKQAVERAGSMLVLLLFSPLLLLAALATRASSPGGVLYRQERVGHRGAVITILKIRTMTTTDGPRGDWATDDLHRVTAVGRVLRRFRIDEMPQLWNVVRGDLSLIGPRPEQVPIVARLAEELPLYQARHWARPGLTGWAQIRFGYGGSFDGARQKLEYDLYYVERQSLILDVKIALGTVRAIVRGVGT